MSEILLNMATLDYMYLAACHINLSESKNLSKLNNAYFVFVLTMLVFSAVAAHNVIQWQNAKKIIPTMHSLDLITGDEPYLLAVTSAIIRHHTVYIDAFFIDENPDPNLTFPEHFQDHDPFTQHAYKLDNGHYVLGDQLGPEYILVPGYMLGGIFGAMMTMAMIMSFTCTLIYKITSKLTNAKTGFFTSLIFSFATLLFVFSNQIYPDVPISLLLIAIIYFAFIRQQSRLSLSVTGALLGLGFLFKPVIGVAALVILPVILYRVYRKQISVKNFVFFLGFALFFISLSLLNNLYVWGTIYGGGNTLAVIDLLMHGIEGHSSGYFTDESQYRPNAILESFFGRSHGLFVFSPVLIFFALGMGILWKKDRLLFAAITVISVLIYTVYILINPISIMLAGDPPFRFFLPIIPLMSIPFALGLYRYGKSILYRICLIVTTVIGLAFSVEFGAYRMASIGNVPVKSEIVDKIYLGNSYFFTNLSTSYLPLELAKKWDPHPLDIPNVLFIAFIVGIIIFCLAWSFREARSN